MPFSYTNENRNLSSAVTKRNKRKNVNMVIIFIITDSLMACNGVSG